MLLTGDERLGGLDRTGFAVCAFLSAGDGYESYARRLVASCRKFSLPHSIWRAPAVHCSISLRGSADLRFTKPAFIGFCLDRLAGASVLGDYYFSGRYATRDGESGGEALPVLVHPTAPPGVKEMEMSHFQLTASIGFTFDTTLAVTEGIADRTPNARAS